MKYYAIKETVTPKPNHPRYGTLGARVYYIGKGSRIFRNENDPEYNIEYFFKHPRYAQRWIDEFNGWEAKNKYWHNEYEIVEYDI